MPLSITALSKHYNTPEGGKLPVLDGMDLEIPQGRFTALVGPSGCGKTTLLRIIAGLETASSGQVRINGQNSPPGPGQVGMVFQQYALFPWRTILANVEMGLELAGMPQAQRRQKAMALITAFGLEGFEKRYPHQLSGGMAQRAALARTLVMEPKVVLMDEPFGSLDSQRRNSLQQFLLEVWQRRQDTIIFVTHNVDEAVFLADEIVVLSRRPTRVLKSIPLELPRPRDRTSAQCNQIRRQVLAVLQDQISGE